MYLSKHQLYLGSLMAFQACTRVMGAATSGVIEVDLVFPRNETYAPSAHMPVVFAIRNPHLAAPLDMNIKYFITTPRKYDESVVINDFSDLNATGSTDSDPYFVYNNTGLVDSEGIWEINWAVEYGKCSRSPGEGIFFTRNTTIDNIIFTTKKGAAKPDLIAASQKDTCATGLAAWNVTGQIDVEGAEWGGHQTCAVVSKRSPWAEVDPCALKFDSAAAEKISAALNQTACAASKSSEGCSADEKDSTDDKDSADEKDSVDENAAGAVRLPVGGVAWLTALVAGLSYVLA